MGRKFVVDYVRCLPHSGTLAMLRSLCVVRQASGNARGTLGRDKVTMAGLTHEEQIFGLVNQPSDEFADFPSDGLLGLSFGTIARSRSPTFVENLVKAKKIRPLFSLHLTRAQEVGSQVQE